MQNEETHMDEAQGQVGREPVSLTRKERNHVAALAAMHMGWAGEAISPTFNKLTPEDERENAQRIAVLFNLREDLGWEVKVARGGKKRWALSLTPPAQLRALLRVWHRGTVEHLTHIERGLAEAIAAEDIEREALQREEVSKTNRCLYRTLDLLARLEREAAEGIAAATPTPPEADVVAVNGESGHDRERPMLTVAEVRAARARINATYQVGETLDDPDAANTVDAQGDEERMSLYERVIGACAAGNVEDATQAMRLAIGWEKV